MSKEVRHVSQKLMLNVIPLNLKPGAKTFSFFKEKPEEEGFVPLNEYEIPKRLEGCKTLYTNFGKRDDADMSVKVSLEESKNFGSHYLRHLLYNWFEGKSAIRKRNFIRDVELYFKRQKNERQNFNAYDRFTLKVNMGRFSEGFEIGIMYGGIMQVWEHAVLDYPGHSTDFTKVVHQGTLHRYEEFRELYPNADYSHVYPVLNRNIFGELGLRSKWKKSNKLRRHTNYIQQFYEQWICDKEFQKVFKPDKLGFIIIPEDETERIDEQAARLRFGHGATDYDPMQGLKKNGPYRAPSATHLDLFIIVSEREAKTAGNDLYKALRDGYGSFPGLSRFARIPVNTSEHNITFSSMADPLPEIREQLSAIDFEPNKKYGAIYISPYDKTHPDPQKQMIYYRLKELLLQYKITSQVIEKSSVFDSSFGYYLPNIATALIAKLGGVPWTLHHKGRSELIIGIGAYRPSKLNKTYLGSAFCFLNDGEFRGFESFAKEDMLKLAGSFQKAIRMFREQHPNIERIVLHYYKRINKKESRVLKDALREMKLDIPLIIVTIYKTGSKDLVLADINKSHRLPLSGTWYKSGRNQFLLCNNTRIPGKINKIRTHPFPLKLYIDIIEPEDQHPGPDILLNDKDWVQELLKQVYQFSRLNWQTVSIKDLPVSIAYPEMVAEKFPYFEGGKIPDFGKENLWFL